MKAVVIDRGSQLMDVFGVGPVGAGGFWPTSVT